MKYKKNVEYVAIIRAGTRRIHFMFSAYDLKVMEPSHTDEQIYRLPLNVAVEYITLYGIWTFLCNDGGITFTANNSDTEELVIVSEVDAGRCQYLSGRHYDAIIEDDMVDALAYAMNPLQPKLTWPSKIKWDGITAEGGDEMKALYHVIFFNRKTEQIHFKSYVAAKDERDATMLAVQIYSGYNSNEHVVIVKQIEGSEYEPIK